MNQKDDKTRVLFVCMGNICRSPTAQGVFHSLVESQNLQESIIVDSAGTHAYHVGEAPDSRSQSAALRRGINLASQRARKVIKDDFELFDWIIAMDRSNLTDLNQLAAANQQHKIHLFMEFAERWDVDEVPDPYYGGSHGFDRVLDMVEDASNGLLQQILSSR